MRVALLQTAVSGAWQENLQCVLDGIRGAREDGADLLCLPEYFAHYGNPSEWRTFAEAASEQVLAQICDRAAACGVAVLAGGLQRPGAGNRVRNVSVFVGSDGTVLAEYTKRHLFDVTLPERTYRESDTLQPGKECVVLDWNGWQIGLATCFDLRFSEHFQTLRRMGAELILVPAAFTATTGKAHWRPLLRSRAIEFQCWVVGAGLTGTRTDGSACYGHSMVVDPWGEIIREIGDQPALCAADLCRAQVQHVRDQIPMASP